MNGPVGKIQPGDGLLPADGRELPEELVDRVPGLDAHSNRWENGTRVPARQGWPRRISGSMRIGDVLTPTCKSRQVGRAN